MGIPNYWTGNKNASFNTFTLTIATTATGNGTVTFTSGAKSVAVAFTTGQTAAVIAANVQAALSNSTIAEIAEQTYDYPGTGGVITITANTAGLPASLSVAITAAVGTTAVLAETVASTGPNQICEAANWSLGKPTNAHELVVSGGPDIYYGLGGFKTWLLSSGGTQPTVLHVMGAFGQGSIGLPQFRAAIGGGNYLEFRSRYLDHGCPLTIVGEGDGGGPALLNIVIPNAGTMRNLGERGVVNILPVTGAAPTLLQIFGGATTHGYAPEGNVGVTVAGLDVTAGTFSAAPGNTFTAVTQEGGAVEMFSNVPGLTISGGEYTQTAGSIDAITGTGGIIHLDQKQATDITVSLQGSHGEDVPYIDCTANSLARQIGTGSYFKGGAYLLDPFGSVALTKVAFETGESVAKSTLGNTITVTRP